MVSRSFLMMVAVAVAVAATLPTASSGPTVTDGILLPLDHRAQQLGQVLEAIVDRRLSQILGHLPHGAAGQLQGLSIADKMAEVFGSHSQHLAHLTASERKSLGDSVQRSIWDTIKEIVDFVMGVLKVLEDPYPIGDLGFELDNAVVVGDVSVKSLTVAHLPEVQIEKYEIHPFKRCVEVHILLPRFALDTTHYDADVSLTLEEGEEPFRVFGAGPGRVEMTNIRVQTDICLQISPFKVEVRDMKVSIEKDLVDLHNLFGGGAVSDLINGIATDIIPGVVEEYQKEITSLIMNYINQIIESLLPGNPTSEPATERHPSSRIL